MKLIVLFICALILSCTPPKTKPAAQTRTDATRDTIPSSSASAGAPFSLNGYEQYDRETEELARQQALRQTHPDTPAAVFESGGDDYEKREITVADTSIYARQIDSLDMVIQRIEKELYKNKKIAKAKKYPTSDKVGYLQHCVKNKIIDTTTALAAAEKFLFLLQMEQQKLQIILSAQSGRDRSPVMLRIRAMQNELKIMGDYVLKSTPPPTLKIKDSKHTY